MSDTVKGYILGIIAAITYGMNPLFALPLYKAGMDPDSVLFFRYILGLPIIALMLTARGRSLRIEKKDIPTLICLGMLLAISSLFLFQSYNYMDAGIASTILFVYPVMVAVIMAIGFKEKLKWPTILSIVMALTGIALLYKGEDGATLNLTGTIIVLISALSYAVYMVWVNQGRIKSMPSLKLTFYVLLFGVTLFAVRLLYKQNITYPPSEEWWLWFNLLALAVFPTLISFACITSAIKYIGSTPTAILGAMEPVTAIFFGVLLFDETLTSRDVLGVVLIIVSVSVVVAGGKMGKYLMRIRKMFPKLGKPKRK